MTRRRSPRSPRCAGVAILICTSLACSAPVGVKRLSPREEYRSLAANVLTSGNLSDQTQIVLRQHGLTAAFDEDPNYVLARLREDIASGTADNTEIFALAEMSSLWAAQTDSKPYALASALYAYAFLFPDDPAQRPQGIDSRYRWAADIYAAGLTQTLRTPGGDSLDLSSRTLPLPWGTMVVDFNRAGLAWGDRMLKKIIPVAEYEVVGMQNRYRHRGIGIAVGATTTRADPNREDLIADVVRVPATVLLRFDDPRVQIADTDLQGRLDIIADGGAVEIGGEQIPLEMDRTAPLAGALVETAFWKQELSLFLGDVLGVRRSARLRMTQPYHPGLIPVVFVHGTASSPARWADMVNDLWDDPLIREHFQFWFFSYDSGNPIAYSAMLLRRSLKEAVAQLDPHGDDPCLQQMVVIGHSQGGLLTKMTVVNSGPVFWDSLSKLPFDQVRMPEKSQNLVKEVLFVEPLPFVTRVIFIATPHQGSYLAGPDFVRRLAAKMISMPRELTTASADIFGATDPAMRITSMERMPTSIDNMSPRQPFIKALSNLPIAPGVRAHSIIPCEGFGPLDDESDGVVRYPSAHIEGVESEKLVRPSSHSTQSNPETVNEVRRILLLQLEQSGCEKKQ